jgi:hypothetical protein
MRATPSYVSRRYPHRRIADIVEQLLDFEVGAHEDTLDIGNVQLYPPQFGYFAKPFYVTQVDPNSEEPLRLRVTGYSFYYSHADTITEAGTELLPMTFRITAIESKSVDPPALTINLLKDVNGRLMIASFQTAKAEEASPIDQEKECKEWPLLCKWKSIVSDKIDGIKKSGVKGCHKNKGNPMEHETTHNPTTTKTVITVIATTLTTECTCSSDAPSSQFSFRS